MPLRYVPHLWVWLKIKHEGLRRVWSMLPLTRVPFWCWLFEPLPYMPDINTIYRLGWHPRSQHWASSCPFQTITITHNFRQTQLSLSLSLCVCVCVTLRVLDTPSWKAQLLGSNPFDTPRHGWGTVIDDPLLVRHKKVQPAVLPP